MEAEIIRIILQLILKEYEECQILLIECLIIIYGNGIDSRFIFTRRYQETMH